MKSNANIDKAEQSERPGERVASENINTIFKIVLDDRVIKLQKKADILKVLGISRQCIHYFEW